MSFSTPVSPAVHSQTQQGWGSHPARLPRGDMAPPALQQTLQDSLCQAVGEPRALLRGLCTAHPIHTGPSGQVTGLPGSALPRRDIPTELGDRVTSPLTALLAVGLGGSSLTPQVVPSPRGSRVLGHNPLPGSSLQGRFGCHSPFPRLQPPRVGAAGHSAALLP